jgi:hypothetical protein
MSAVREAHAVLHLAMETPAPQHKVVEAAIIRLGDALEAYEELDACALSWEWVFPELRGEADPDEAALQMAAGAAEVAAQDLVEAMAAHPWHGHDARPLAMAGITAGGDAGTEEEATIPGVGK